MPKKFLISYVYAVYNCNRTWVTAEGHGSEIVELETLPQNEEELEVLRKSLSTYPGQGSIRRILVISPLS
jgi:hypothetical protein